MCFLGPPGLGKTSLAHIIAREHGRQHRVHLRAGDRTSRRPRRDSHDLEEGDVLFIDEIHRLARPVEEVLYPAMEDFELNIVVGKGIRRAHDAAGGEAVHTGRRDHPVRTVELATARPLRPAFPSGLYTTATS